MADDSFVLRCGHCGNQTAFSVRAEYEYRDIHDVNPLVGNYGVHVEWRILQCPVCGKPTFHQILAPVDREGRYDDEYYVSVLYPVEKVILRDLPTDVATVYREALRLAPLSPSGCAVIMGRTLEVICRREGAVDGTLYARLQHLANSGRVPETLARMAQQVRLIRNLGAHADATGDEVKESDIPVILDFMDAILEYLYVAPARITALEARLNHP